MAGFAVNLKFLSQNPGASMPYKAGYEEDHFLKSLTIKIDDIEVKAANCTEIYVWHTQTKQAKRKVLKDSKNDVKHVGSNIYELQRVLRKSSMVQ